MPKYLGHKNWNHWNVKLWLTGNEFEYRLMLSCIRCTRNRDEAAARLLGFLPAATPDGAPYTKTSVKAAMVGLGDGR